MSDQIQPAAPDAMAAPGDVMTPPPDRATVQGTLLRAIERAAEDAAGAKDAREVRELGQAALSFAQAVAVLDPDVDQAGTSVEHQAALEELRGQQAHDRAIAVQELQGAQALEQAQAAAAAQPAATRRSVTVRRDDHGRPAAYDLSEG